jgi:hypothetical protein
MGSQGLVTLVVIVLWCVRGGAGRRRARPAAAARRGAAPAARARRTGCYLPGLRASPPGRTAPPHSAPARHRYASNVGVLLLNKYLLSNTGFK